MRVVPDSESLAVLLWGQVVRGAAPDSSPELPAGLLLHLARLPHTQSNPAPGWPPPGDGPPAALFSPSLLRVRAA